MTVSSFSAGLTRFIISSVGIVIVLIAMSFLANSCSDVDTETSTSARVLDNIELAEHLREKISTAKDLPWSDERILREVATIRSDFYADAR